MNRREDGEEEQGTYFPVYPNLQEGRNGDRKRGGVEGRRASYSDERAGKPVEAASLGAPAATLAPTPPRAERPRWTEGCAGMDGKKRGADDHQGSDHEAGTSTAALGRPFIK